MLDDGNWSVCVTASRPPWIGTCDGFATAMVDVAGLAEVPHVADTAQVAAADPTVLTAAELADGVPHAEPGCEVCEATYADAEGSCGRGTAGADEEGDTAVAPAAAECIRLGTAAANDDRGGDEAGAGAAGDRGGDGKGFLAAAAVLGGAAAAVAFRAAVAGAAGAGARETTVGAAWRTGDDADAE